MASYTLFRAGEQVFAYPTERVSETVKLERMFPVPKAPPHIKGVTNLRNRVIPVVDTGRLLWNSPLESDTAIILEVNGSQVCLPVSRVLGIAEVEEDHVKSREEIEIAEVREELIEAVFERNSDVVFILNLSTVLKPEKKGRRSSQKKSSALHSQESGRGTEETEGFVIFPLSSEWFALPVEEVREIVELPDRIAEVPQAPDYVEGIFLLRNEEVVLISLKRLLKVPSGGKERRAIVARLGGATVGIAVDDVKEIRWVSRESILPLEEHTGKGVVVLDRGERLAMVLSLRELFRGGDVEGLVEEKSTEGDEEEEASMRSFVSFTVGDVEMAVSIEKVREVIETDEITPLPRAPSYIKGVYNLRSSVIAIISLPERLEMRDATDSNRVVVLETVPVGLTVTRLKGILRAEEDRIQPVEEVTDLEEDLLEGVIRTDDGVVFILSAEKVVRREDLELLEERVEDG